MVVSIDVLFFLRRKLNQLMAKRGTKKPVS
jgi:hypothetical protein